MLKIQKVYKDRQRKISLPIPSHHHPGTFPTDNKLLMPVYDPRDIF
jgi:hypothetical protein